VLVERSFRAHTGDRGEELRAALNDRPEPDALEAELKPLVGGPIVTQMFRWSISAETSRYHVKSRSGPISTPARLGD
jgi:hypothetical protein